MGDKKRDRNTIEELFAGLAPLVVQSGVRD